jgi:hypothetical protein
MPRKDPYSQNKKCKRCGKLIGNRNKTGYCNPCRNKTFPVKHTEETKEKMRKAKWGKKNPNWQGDNIKYNGLHRWVERRIEKPDICPRCKKRPAIDLTNKGVYDRNLDNWEYLCRHCHMKEDGRLKQLTSWRGD